MARTMTDEQEAVCRAGDNPIWVRGLIAELDAERAAHEETKKDAEGWRNGQAQMQAAFDALWLDFNSANASITELKARLARAEAVCRGVDAVLDARAREFDLDALAAWRAAK